MKTKKIPTYAADGERRRDYPVASIELLLSREEVTVQRNRKGEIVSAAFLPEKQDEHSGRSEQRSGFRTIFRQHIGERFYVWSHAEQLCTA